MGRVILLIPVRYASTRFPGKALFKINGKPLIRHVVERAVDSKADDLIVATDNVEVESTVRDLCRTVITKGEYASGTDRIAEVANRLDADYILNLQGDQLITGPEILDSILAKIHGGLAIATLFMDIHSNHETEDENVVKVVINKIGNVIYMSRFPIPYNRKMPAKNKYYKQIGIYVFSKNALLKFASLEPSALEMSEGIELLRVLDYGDTLKGIHTSLPVHDVDVLEDIAGAEAFIDSYPVKN